MTGGFTGSVLWAQVTNTDKSFDLLIEIKLTNLNDLWVDDVTLNNVWTGQNLPDNLC